MPEPSETPADDEWKFRTILISGAPPFAGQRCIVTVTYAPPPRRWISKYSSPAEVERLIDKVKLVNSRRRGKRIQRRNHRRDIKILRRVCSGDKVTAIALDSSLSISRIYDIVDEQSIRAWRIDCEEWEVINHRRLQKMD